MLPQAGAAGRALARVMSEAVRTDPEVALLLLAGMNLCSPRPSGSVLGRHEEESAMASWLLDKITKNFLVRCWRSREVILGRVKVVQKQVVWVPTLGSMPRPFTMRQEFGPEWRSSWVEWISRVRGRGGKTAHSRGNFFVVWPGDSNLGEVFYRWCDARRAARVPGSRVRGFAKLVEAYDAAGRTGRP